MTDSELKPHRSLVKEIQIDKGVFPLKSKITNKFSASESYKESILRGILPSDSPTSFKDAIPNIFYAPESDNIISYKLLHDKINEEKEQMLKAYPIPTDDEKKKIQIESSKKIMKEFGVNDKTYMIYSPVLVKKFEDGDEFCKISATYDQIEKIIFVKTELLPRPNKIQENPFDFLQIHIDGVEIPHEINISEPVPEIKETPVHEEKPEDKKKVDIEELKKKYKFQKPQGESISDILKRSKKGYVAPVAEEEIVKPKTPDEELRDFISDNLPSITGKWEDDVFNANQKESGYLLPIEMVEILKDKIIIKSSPVTNIEWWTKFLPIEQCPRFKGALYIEDSYAPFCEAGKCNDACGAEDGFVELSAARFRLVEEGNLLKKTFARLQEFIDRANRLIDEFKGTFEVDIQLYIGTQSPYLYSLVKRPVDDLIIKNYLEAFVTIYHEITDIRGKIDIEQFNLDEDYDPVSEDGLLQESRNYGLQEMVKLGAMEMLKEIIKQKDGKMEGNYFLIDKGRLRYIFRNNRIECIRDELYMGNAVFKNGLKEVQDFLVTTLGGGRW